MCIRDRGDFIDIVRHEVATFAIERIIGQEGFNDKLDQPTQFYVCLLYTSDAADERSSVDLGGRRIIKKKKTVTIQWM